MAKDINLTSQEWCNIVFEGKNKQYGAYKLRRNTYKRSLFALVAVLGFTVLVAFAPTLVETVKSMAKNTSEGLTEKTTLANVQETDDIQNEIVKQQETLPEPPLKSTIKFTAPIMVTENEISDDDRLKSQDEFNENKLTISIANVQGTDEEHGIDYADLQEHKAIVDTKEPVVYKVADQMPEYPGGLQELNKFIHDHLQYPEVAFRSNIQGTVMLEFVVKEDGKIGTINVLVDPYSELSKEAIRVLRLVPKWIPGRIAGKPVSVWHRIPIVFKLNN